MQFRFQARAAAMFSAAAMSGTAAAQEQPVAQEDVDAVVVWGRATELIGKAQAASEGTVGYADFETRPISRAGELVEVIPGVSPGSRPLSRADRLRTCSAVSRDRPSSE